MEANETKERKLYHQYLIRLDDETIIELLNKGFQFKTCFVWKKCVLPDEIENGEMSLDYSKGYPQIIFNERPEINAENVKKTSVVEFFIEDGCRNQEWDS